MKNLRTNNIFTQYSINAVVVQPVVRCEENCPGCYVKKYEQQHPGPDDYIHMGSICSKLIRDSKINQLSISLNTPSDADWELETFLRIVSDSIRHQDEKNRLRPEVHVSMSLKGLDMI